MREGRKPIQYSKQTKRVIHQVLLRLRNGGSSYEEIIAFCKDHNISMGNGRGAPTKSTLRGWLTEARLESNLIRGRLESVWAWSDQGNTPAEIVELCRKNNVRTNWNTFPSSQIIARWIKKRPISIAPKPITKPTTKPQAAPKRKAKAKQDELHGSILTIHVNKEQREWLMSQRRRGKDGGPNRKMTAIIQELIDSKTNPTIKAIYKESPRPTIKTIYQESLDVTYRDIEIIDQSCDYDSSDNIGRPAITMYRLCDVVSDLFNALLTLGLRFSIIGMIIEDVLEWGELLSKKNRHLIPIDIFVDRLRNSLRSRGIQSNVFYGILNQVFK